MPEAPDPTGPDEREAAALNGMIREWDRIAREGASGSPRDHCRRLLRAAQDASAIPRPVTVSEEAIEAAYEAVQRRGGPMPSPSTIRAALEAALPYLQGA